MTTHAALEALSLPRAQAFERGLLVPVSRATRRDHDIPMPIRFTARAWEALVDYSDIGPSGRRHPSPETIRVRLGRVLMSVASAVRGSAGRYLVHNHVLELLLPDFRELRASAGHCLTVAVILTQDEEGADVLTVLAPEEGTPVM